MNFKDLGKQLLQGSRRRDDGLIVAYQKRFREIQESVSRFPGLKSRLMVADNVDAFDLIRFSAFANDLTQLSLEPSNEMKIRLPPPNDLAGGQPLKITFRTDLSHQFHYVDGQVQASPAFILRSDRFAKQTINTIAPLMMNGRVIVEPVRGILVPRMLPTPDGRTQWDMLAVDENSPFNEWTLEDRSTSENPSIPLVQSPFVKEGERKLYEVSIPFLSGIGFADLAKVLDDENHHLADARQALRSIVSNAEEGDVSVIVNDVLRPKLDALERRFRSIAGTHRIRQGSAIFGTMTVALMAYATGGLSQVVTALAGAGGLGLVAKQQADVREKRDALKEDPHYLLWRLRSIRRDT